MPTLARAALAGALHGPTELLPVSSSAHVALLQDEPDAELRKAFEVALHAGTAAALLLALRGEVAEAATG
ncbi:MAG: undecaprenyl-diphosphatase, partial [Actinomycetota bacterium]|nr:undecaprenyl-diphosphatase [Actinomycetota bacterium]